MKRPIVAVGIVIAVAALVWATELYLASADFAASRVRALDDFHKEQLALYREKNQLLTTLCTLVFGAVGALLLKSDATAGAVGLHKGWAFASCALAGVSIYFGYVSHEQVIWMLDSRFFDLFNDVVAWPSRIQFFSFLFAVALFAIAINPRA
jgi:hypothetical protein